MGPVFTIASETAFVDSLARGLLSRFGPQVEDVAAGDDRGDGHGALAEVHVLLPTRRACRALGEAFLRAAGGAPMLLPAMTPIGDVDEDEIGFLAGEEPALAGLLYLPPAIPALRRQLLLTRLIMARAVGTEEQGRDTPSAAHAARLATELGRLLDEVQTERLDFAKLADIVPERFAEHWQETLSFLQIVTEFWPAILAEEGCLDPADRRNRLIEAQIELWRATPPQGPVIAAGSTGSVPATADLLACVAALSNGAVVLPGLDITLDLESLAALGPGHPQFGMARLIDRLGVGVADVADWETAERGTVDEAHTGRMDIVNGALRPPATAAAFSLPETVGVAFAGVRRIDCAGPQQEALTIALMMRDALEAEECTAALVTPDRRLARRVAAELRRWQIDIDDSGGLPLADTLPGSFLRLTAEAVAHDFAPVPMLAALKHPLAAGGRAPAGFRDAVREIERLVLRGARPAPGFDGLRRALDHLNDPPPDMLVWLTDMEARVGTLAELMPQRSVDVVELLDAHVAFAERLAQSDTETGVERLWAGEAGESAAALINELRAAAETLPPISGHEWPALLEALMAGSVVRPLYGRHPRLNIWGLLEARLQQADLVILGGLNEGVWPPDPTVDPWMSRPMRADFGLPPPERRIGLTAHDFAQGFAAREVVLTRSTRIDGSPTVPARWLTRLETLLGASETGQDVLRGWAGEQARWLHWQAEIDSRLPPVPVAPPAPVPPVETRPTRLSVTEIETLIRDPYAVYARRVLGLSAMDTLDADPGAADRGSIIHNAIDRFLGELAHDLPADALDRLLEIGEAEFGPYLDRPGIRAFWWPRFERIAAWIVEQEHARTPSVAARHTEISGELNLSDRPRPFTLRARADRIDRLADGGYAIIDYKTGRVPSKSDVTAGLSPQLSLEAAMIKQGAFPDIPPGEIAELAYWKLSGGDPAGKISAAGDDPEALAAAALDGLIGLLDHYDDPASSYPARPDAEIAPAYNDYDHLERVQEWTAAGGGE